MRPGMKMLLLANKGGSGSKSGGGNSGNRGGNRSEMNMGYDGMEYGMENTYAESRIGRGGNRANMEYGRAEMNYPDAGYTEYAGGYGMEMAGGRGRQGRNRSEMEMAGRRGGNRSEMEMGGYEMEDGEMEMAGRRYRRDSRGRFMPRNEYAEMEMEGRGMESHYPIYPYMPPIYREEREKPGMRAIGFNTSPQPEMMERPYKQVLEYPKMNEFESMTSEAALGYAKGHGEMKLTKEMAEEWMENIQNEDGTKGAHWSFEQAKQVMAQKGVKAEPLDFWTALNAMYADYCKVFKKYGVGDKLDLYVDMAKAFIEDKDAEGNKVSKYYQHIVKK